MIRKIILLSLFFGILSTNAQKLDEYLSKIDLKLRKDKDYLNLHALTFQPEPEKTSESLKSVPRVTKEEPFTMLFDENVSYRVVFLKEGIGIDSVYVLYLDQITRAAAATEGLFGALSAPSDDTLRVLTFTDMYKLKMNDAPQYAALKQYIDKYLRENEETPPESLLRINPDEEIHMSLGISSRDNADYFNHVKVYDLTWFSDQTEKQGRGSRRGAADAAAGKTTFKIDASASKIMFSHEAMNAILEDGGASVELNFEEPVLHLLPWESNTVAAAIRMLFLLSPKDKVTESTFLNARFGARFPIGTTAVYDNQPWILGDTPVMNFKPSFLAEFNFTRLMGLPFINLYFSASQGGQKSPDIIVTRNNQKVAYFSHAQAMMSYSFYWNTSDKMTSRFRMDVGGGYYSVTKGTYSNSGSLTSSKEVHAKFQPMVALNFTWVPKDNPILGGTLRVFDGRARINTWLAIFKIAPFHTFRLEAIYQAGAMFRKAYEWETDGGAMVQLRYRYGLNN
ncbi:MAG: hypothetical protein K9G57_01050 [Ignavibacteriales bacterium]|nr:hypothetical protein [Ignavibacteriales bacterium]